MATRRSPLFLLLAVVLAQPVAARAQEGAVVSPEGGVLSKAAAALRDDPVYVDPQAERRLSPGEASLLRRRIGDAGAGPIYLAVLPERARNESGGDASAALRELALGVGEPGTYAAVVGSALRAGSTGGLLPRGRAGELAAESLRAQRSPGTAAVLSDFVERVAAARRERGDARRTRDAPHDGGGFPVVLLLLGIPAAIFGFSRFRRRRRERAELEEVKAFAREDLVALGDDIRRLDLDVEMPDADEAARGDYARAVECYQAADEAWTRAGRVEDMERVTSLLEEGRYAMAAARARLEGQPVPERRAPCFFDPRHGPSTTEVEWAPAGGSPRPVPVCAADAQRVEDGLEPQARQVPVGGQLTPYWNAGPAYAPWAGGFFGGGLLPGLFIGSMLGGGLGLFGGLATDAAAQDYGDFGGEGSLGAGDFGGDVGDIGGGDFGGGDF